MNDCNGDKLDAKLSKIASYFSTLLSEIGNYFSNVTIIFLFYWFFFTLFFLNYEYLSAFENSVLFLIFLMIFLLSLIVIDFLNYYVKLNLISILLLIIVFSIRKFSLYSLTHNGMNDDFPRGFVIGTFFYSIISITLLPFFASFISKNKKILLPMLVLIILFIYDYSMDLLNINNINFFKNEFRYIVNFLSYALALLIFMSYKNNIKYKDNNLLYFARNKSIKLLISLFGLPIFLLFLIFA
ncbi:hypothetical protein U0021_09025 [Moraxella canis]|uniref:Uncharacterized protein n=1 Tax=Moraxella canis TaxID=90239 RepID=A0ABZ0WX85_9GAMM|nr:hypothetical protein [Moraxella canis]WQE03864.1 hypothetical protein U0021_09025 [Moraxella canis]